MPAEVRQLSRGRHRLTREQVLASQRGRILAAMADAVAQKGFARVTVADVIAGAGVSRETFYEQFSDKEDCFLAALDAGVEVLLEELAAALQLPASDPIERLERVLDAYLTALTTEPAFAKAFLIDAYGAGPPATNRRVSQQQRFIDLVSGIFGVTGESDPLDRFACEALVGAISSMVTVRVSCGRFNELRALRAPMVALARRVMPSAAQPKRRRKSSR